MFDWIESIQKVAPFIVSLSSIPKLILSATLIAFTSFLLAILWSEPRDEAVGRILAGCYRRAVFTRTHAQLSMPAMFKSISECRLIVQKEIPNIVSPRLREDALRTFTALNSIEGMANLPSPELDKINDLKLVALGSLQELSQRTAFPFPIPPNLTEETFFSSQDADLAPTLPSQPGP